MVIESLLWSQRRPVALKWRKKGNGEQWYSLRRLNLSTVTDRGVYVIKRFGKQERTIYVGQGDISERLSRHRNSYRITRHGNTHDLKVTWAPVLVRRRSGVERYLHEALEPLEGTYQTDDPPIKVNLP